MPSILIPSIAECFPLDDVWVQSSPSIRLNCELFNQCSKSLYSYLSYRQKKWQKRNWKMGILCTNFGWFSVLSCLQSFYKWYKCLGNKCAICLILLIDRFISGIALSFMNKINSLHSTFVIESLFTAEMNLLRKCFAELLILFLKLSAIPVINSIDQQINHKVFLRSLMANSSLFYIIKGFITARFNMCWM